MRTISAIGTPHGVGAVSIIRLSGEDALAVAERVFCPKGSTPLSERAPRSAVYGTFRDERGEFDDGIAVLYPAPASYTGENMAELMCHGGILATRRLLAATVAAGAFPAVAGEFTKRAFINGKLSLSQAEAVGLLIEAKTDSCLTIGIKQLGGALTKRINVCSDALTAIAASVYAYIDYPEEDLTDYAVPELMAELERIGGELNGLASGYRYGKAVTEGVKCAIVGCPNVGKSSVLNLLAGEERAIVTDIAGTTRDVVTESVTLGDILLHLADTAGIREGGGKIERIGIQKSIDSLESAELVLAVFDGARPADEGDRQVIEHINAAGKTAVTVGIINKCDKDSAGDYSDLPFPAVRLSAVTGEGLEELTAAVTALYSEGGIQRDMGETVVNARQHGAIVKAARAVERALDALRAGYTQDVAGFDIEEAIAALGELEGRQVSEDIVNEIFSRFCVGK